ncbi:predicted protein [Thalassiosira pseudonana CCMP1335]|uniref:EF-hand domain-containing protein n=1 Tax=Thalassiosira pseudonana TaxID=35128 RepID=B8BWF5_THAPS|nr:predicted protein [Thalassiosira pseudonana CCMP1335]EED94508.1 predicted protein [Thalassiosira pseudonana CCMP1335]
MASVMDVATKLRFALEVFDYKQTGRVSKKELQAVIGAINTTASYFGDAVLLDVQIEMIVDDLFEGEDMIEDGDEILYTDMIFKMTNNPLVIEFVSGAGTARHGTVQ